MKKTILTVFLSLVITMPALCMESMPSALQGVLIAKMLVFQKKIEQTAVNGMITVCVLYDDNQKAADGAENLVAEFKKVNNSGLKIKGFPINCVMVHLAPDTNLKKELNARHTAALCVFSSGENIGPIVEATRALKVLSIACLDPEQNVTKGISVGLAVDNGKSKILINTDSTALEDREFESSFLSLTTIVNK